MAIAHNAMLRATELTRGIKRMLGMDADQEATSRLSETLYPTFDAWGRPEFNAPRGETLFWGGQIVGAIAAQKAKVQLKFPVACDLVAIVNKLYIFNTSGYAIAQLGNAAGLTSSGSIQHRDTRNQGGIRLTKYWENSAGAGPGTACMQVLGSSGIWHPVDVVLYGRDPTAGLTVYSDSDNVNLLVGWLGSVRTLLPGEALR